MYHKCPHQYKQNIMVTCICTNKCDNYLQPYLINTKLFMIIRKYIRNFFYAKVTSIFYITVFLPYKSREFLGLFSMLK